MSFFKKMLYVNIIIASIMTLTACGSVSKKTDNHDFLTDISGLVLEASAVPTLLYVRPNASSLAAYNSFIIDPVQVNYRDPAMKRIAADDLEKIQRYFRDSVASELTDAGYTVTSEPAIGTMRLSFILSGMAAPSAKANIIAVLAPIAISVGKVTVEAVFRESVSNRIDAVAVQKSQGSRVLNAKAWSTWADIEAAFDQWAKGIADSVTLQHQQN